MGIWNLSAQNPRFFLVFAFQKGMILGMEGSTPGPRHLALRAVRKDGLPSGVGFLGHADDVFQGAAFQQQLLEICG